MIHSTWHQLSNVRADIGRGPTRHSCVAAGPGTEPVPRDEPAAGAERGRGRARSVRARRGRAGRARAAWRLALTEEWRAVALLALKGPPNRTACAAARPLPGLCAQRAARTGYPNSLRQRHLAAHKASLGSARRSPPNVSRNERVKLSRHARMSLRHDTREIVTCGSKM